MGFRPRHPRTQRRRDRLEDPRHRRYQRLALEAHAKLAPADPLTAPEPGRRRVRAPDYDPLVVERLKLGD